MSLSVGPGREHLHGEGVQLVLSSPTSWKADRLKLGPHYSNLSSFLPVLLSVFSQNYVPNLPL